MNTVTIVGNVTRDPELRYGNNGTALTTIGIAHNRRQKAADGTWEDAEPAFYDVVCFGTLAENVSEQISKGQRVIVAGQLQQRSWETPDGDRRSKVELKAEALGPDLRWASDKPSGRPSARPDVDEAPF